MPGFLAVHDHQFVAGRRTAQLPLDGQQALVELGRIDPGQEPAAGGLRGSRILALGITPDAQSAPLALTQAPGKFLQIRLTARRLAEHGQQNEGRQAEQRITFHALPVIGEWLEVFDDRADFLHPVRAARSGLGLHHRRCDCPHREGRSENSPKRI